MSLRTPQNALREYIRQVAAGARFDRIVAVMLPGSGKSWTPAIIAKEAIDSGKYTHVFVVTSRLNLMDSMADDFNNKIRRVLGHRGLMRISTNDDNPFRGLDAVVTSYQALAAMTEKQILSLIRVFEWNNVALVLDECHHLIDPSVVVEDDEGDDDEDDDEHRDWVRVPLRLAPYAKLRVHLTGTPDVHRRVWGLPYVAAGRGRFVLGLPERTGVVDNVAYVINTRAEARAEKYMLPIEFYSYDGPVAFKVGAETHALPEITERTAHGKRIIRAALQTEMAEKLLVRATNDLVAYRAAMHAWAKQLVVCMSVREARRRTRMLKERYKDTGLRIECAVATDEGGKPSQEGRELIRRFKLAYTDETAIDILVTVGMAYEGMDVEAVMFVVIATHIRSVPYLKQLFGRGTRTMPGILYEEQICRIYGIDDPWMRAAIEIILAEQVLIIREQAHTVDRNTDQDEVEPAPFIPISSDLQRERVSDDTLDVEYARAEHLRAVIAAVAPGQITVLQLEQMTRLANTAARPAPVAGNGGVHIDPNAEEVRLRNAIADICRKADAEKANCDWGRHGLDLWERAGKRKLEVMPLPELHHWFETVCHEHPEIARRLGYVA